jgi:AAA15 family ATPase/GTPase
MIKLKQIKISGIRGIKESLSLSLDKKSLLIYGDNGTGKSSITDSIEWFYKDKIAHLAGNEIGKDSIRNIFILIRLIQKSDFSFPTINWIQKNL